jgi:hypothetical protein
VIEDCHRVGGFVVSRLHFLNLHGASFQANSWAGGASTAGLALIDYRVRRSSCRRLIRTNHGARLAVSRSAASQSVLFPIVSSERLRNETPVCASAISGMSPGFRVSQRSKEKEYCWAYLDTEPHTMAAAHRTYLTLGFKDYQRKGIGAASVSFLRKRLSRGSGSQFRKLIDH